MNVTGDVRYIGVNDHEIDLFEGQYIVPLGMSYNSYVILDEKICVMDTVDANFGDEWVANLEKELAGRKPDYLVVQHMEPDHSANITKFMDRYPGAVVVASAKAFEFMNNFYGSEYRDRRIVVGEGDRLELGKHVLSFICAPMVHWPEVIFSYESTDKLLFSADAFGKFGANDAEDPEGWTCEARRYYFGIVGKYGAQVQAVLKKAANLDIRMICPLHGPVLDSDLGYYLGLYDTWSSYKPEDEGITIAYTSIYGNTRKAAELLAERLKAEGQTVEITDLARDDIHEAVESAFRYDRLVLATSTYNADIFPYMKTFIDKLAERCYRNRKVGLIENGSWSPMAAKVMKRMLGEMKDIELLEPVVTVRSALNAESEAQLNELCKALCR